MNTTIQHLREHGYTNLADILETQGARPIDDYSHEIWRYRPSKSVEPQLLEAFQEELEYCKTAPEIIVQILNQLRDSRVIQTTHHTAIAPRPRMFCIDWISTRSLPSDMIYPVATFSGVPFSNSTKPGRVTISGNEYNLISSTHQDELVYKSLLTEKSLEVFQTLPNHVQNIFPAPVPGESFSKWANICHQSLLTNLLQKNSVVFDINNVIARYIPKVIQNENHLLHKLFYNKKFQKEFFNVFGNEIHFFFAPHQQGKYHKQDNLYLDGYSFKGDHVEHITDPAIITKELIAKNLCPAPILVFTVLTFLNDFKCLGSFAQAEYLSLFKENWMKLGLENIENAPVHNLTSGMFPSNPGLEALDILNGKEIIPEKNYTVFELFKPVIDGGFLYKSNKR